MREWKKQIRLANDLYAKKHFSQALFEYQKATTVAKQEFNEQIEFDPEGAVASVVIGYLNTADVLAVLGQHDRAVSPFTSAQKFLQNLAKEHGLSLEFSEPIARAKARLFSEWTLYIKQHQQHLSSYHMQCYNSAAKFFNDRISSRQYTH